MKKKVLVLAEAASDIERGIDFYNTIDDGVAPDSPARDVGLSDAD